MRSLFASQIVGSSLLIGIVSPSIILILLSIISVVMLLLVVSIVTNLARMVGLYVISLFFLLHYMWRRVFISIWCLDIGKIIVVISLSPTISTSFLAVISNSILWLLGFDDR